jgi:7,8-dihydropterin-6-yl-methyl-4-(beta-D-ribofuranosyl)aminobenzene 5'-phosphate synthase
MNSHRSSLSLAAFICALFALAGGRASAYEARDGLAPVVDDYKITILSDSIPGRYTIGEWGFSALVEVTSGGVSKRFLFDTSDKPGTVSFNAEILFPNLDLCDIEDVVLSHNNADHVGGLVSLRKQCLDENPGRTNAFARAHVGAEEIFWKRIGDSDQKQKNPMVSIKGQYEALGGQFVVNDQPHEFLLPGVFLSGRIARTHDEKTYVPTTPMKIEDPRTGQLGTDYVPEDQSLVINTRQGVVVLSGCAHAGAINTIEQAVRMVGGHRLPVILAGGLHWFQMEKGNVHTVGSLDWEAQKMTELNVVAMLGGHCTGFERFFYIRSYIGLDPTRAALAAVGVSLSTNTQPGYNTKLSFTTPLAVNTPVQIDNSGSGNHRNCRPDRNRKLNWLLGKWDREDCDD